MIPVRSRREVTNGHYNLHALNAFEQIARVASVVDKLPRNGAVFFWSGVRGKKNDLWRLASGCSSTKLFYTHSNGGSVSTGVYYNGYTHESSFSLVY